MWFKHLSSLCGGELAPPKHATLVTGRTRRYYQTSTRCFGDKVAALTHDDVETVPKCHSRRLPSFLNPSARRNKVGLSGGYLTPVITERPALQTAAAAAASCFLLLSLRNGTADKQLLSKATSWYAFRFHLSTNVTCHLVSEMCCTEKRKS